MTARYQHKHFILQLHTLSPLHIGNGEQLSSTGEYFVSSNHVFFLDNDQLMRHLHDQGLLREYVGEIHEKGTSFDFYRTLEKLGVTLGQFTKRKLQLHQDGLITDKNNELRLFIKSNESAYVPGSSFKGMVRNTLIFKFLKDHPNEVKDLNDTFGEILERGEVTEKKALLSKLKRTWAKKEEQIIPNVISGAIRFSDSSIIGDDDQLVVEQVIRQHLYGENTEGLDWLCECIGKGQELSTEFTLYYQPKVDYGYYNWIKDDLMPRLFSLLNDYSLHLIKEEIDLLNLTTHNATVRDQIVLQLKGYKEQIIQSKNKHAVIRLGQGKTIFFQTILPLLSPGIKSDLLNLIFGGPEEGTDALVIPKTRSVTAFEPQTLGWVKLTYAKPPKKLFRNEVAEIIADKTIIKAYVSGNKKVDFILNDILYEDVQLTLPYKVDLNLGAKIDVVIRQITKVGKINQVRYLP